MAPPTINYRHCHSSCVFLFPPSQLHVDPEIKLASRMLDELSDLKIEGRRRIRANLAQGHRMTFCNEYKLHGLG